MFRFSSRSADGATDLYNPNTLVRSPRAIFTVPFCSASVASTIEWLTAHRELTIYTARLDATIDYSTADFTRPCAIVLGSETKRVSVTVGFRRPSRNRGTSFRSGCRCAVRSIASMFSAAAAILFYEALRQRESHTRAVRR